MRTRDQDYAGKISDQVARIANADEEFRTKYGSMSHRLPVLIRTAGLAQALGLVESRGTPGQKQLLQDIAEVVRVPDICGRSRQADLGEYMKLTRDVMAALVWYKRFAESLLDVKPGADDNEGAGE